MAAATILMAILGCGDAGTQCEPVGVSPVRYQSVSACIAAQDEVLARSAAMYPVLTAQCRPAGVASPAKSEPNGAQVPNSRKRFLRQASLRG